MVKQMGNRLGKGVLMEIKLDVKDGKVRGSVMNLEVVETLVMIRALRDFSENSENHPNDIRVALRMLDDVERGVFRR